MKLQLRVPGPTPLPTSVRVATGKQMINHRSQEFADIFLGLTKKLQTVFQTRQDVLIFPGSGTGGLEASIVNLFSPAETVLAVIIGSFGKRYADIAEAFGLKVLRQEFPPGSAADPRIIDKTLRENKEIVGILITHNETSTGVTNPIAEIAKVIKKQQKLLLVDAVSSLGAIDLPIDEHGIDVAITASQKAWMAPPGLTMLNVSERAWQAHKQAKLPRYYWDFSRAKKYLTKGQTPYTPAVATLFALDAALNMIVTEGVAKVFARHKRLGEQFREKIKDLGLTLFADERFASNTVTAINTPPLMTAQDLISKLSEHDIVVASGQDDLQDKIIRIAHMGYVGENDINDIVGGLRKMLQ